MRWLDNEWLLIDKRNADRCLIITLNFLGWQSEAARLVTPDKKSYCRTVFEEPQFGTNKAEALALSKRRPCHPDIIWHFHGLWRLPHGGSEVPTEAGACAQRFHADVEALRTWAHHVPMVMWQSTFPILGHSSIRNPYLKWEFECQNRTVARASSGLNMFDTYSYVRDRLPGSIIDNDPTHGFHYSAAVQEHIVDEIAMCARALGVDMTAPLRQSAYRKAGSCKAHVNTP